jgi:hypothetical protein
MVIRIKDMTVPALVAREKIELLQENKVFLLYLN